MNKSIQRFLTPLIRPCSRPLSYLSSRATTSLSPSHRYYNPAGYMDDDYYLPVSPAVSPFSQTVISSMRKLYPECLADKSFDNTGLMLESPVPQTSASDYKLKTSVLLCIDLTQRVCQEAIENKHSIIVAYHPIIFRGLKSVTTSDPQQRTLLRLASHGISVYSPHTAVDAVPGGMADWLADIVTTPLDKQDSTEPTPHTKTPIVQSTPGSIHEANRIFNHAATTDSDDESNPYNKKTTGSGRLIKFQSPVKMLTLMQRAAARLHTKNSEGEYENSLIAVAQPHGHEGDGMIHDVTTDTVLVCPGSGSSVFSKAHGLKAPYLLLTGEMSHHDALYHTERGGYILTVRHSVSERGYLSDVMRQKLLEEVKEQWAIKRKEKREGSGGNAEQKVVERIYNGQEEVTVEISRSDHDPYVAYRWDD